MIRRPTYLLASLALAATLLHAGDFTAEDAGKLVERLGHKEFKVRQAASKELEALVKDSPEIAELFTPYKKHADPEVKVRVREALAKQTIQAGWLSPEMEGKILSPQDRLPRRVRMVNNSNMPVKIFWLDYEGKRMPWSPSVVRPGSSRTCHTSYAGHAWLFTSETGKGLGIYILGIEPGDILFNGPVKQAGPQQRSPP